ncbi:MAG: YihY/virulence factor BrkB family protein [Flavobacteriales bacterium]|nr:YihY/virulence factor BrkB family protein [Flavobacteriales bacterium]
MDFNKQIEQLELRVKARLTPAKKLLQRKTLPGFKGRSIYDVGKFFVDSLFDSDLNVRASSLAYNFFLSLFPAIIFLFTLIAYIPIDGFQEDLLQQIERVLPRNTFEALFTTIEDILNNQNITLLSFGFVLAIYFSSTAFQNMMTNFNKYTKQEHKRNWFASRVRSIWLTLLVTMTVLIMVLVVTYINISLYMLDIEDKTRYILLQVLQVGSIYFLIYLVYSSLYYFGSSKTAKWNFFSVGSSLATILTVLASAAFTFYVNNFSNYNRFYGSVGAFIVLMVFIYFNCTMLLIGFELNSSIDRAEIRSIKNKE